MAPYEGDVAAVNVNELEFVKFAEEAADKNGVWGTVKLMDNTNGTWTATIPADIKPGKYIIRHEVGSSPELLSRHGLEMPRTEPVSQIIALHFALSTTPNFAFTPIGPQFYMTCFNFNVTGSGTATPKGAKFPGAYDMADPALNWDLNSTAPYPLAGPKVYTSAYAANLEPNKLVTISPTLDADGDVKYYDAQYKALEAQGGVTSYFDSIGG